MTNDQDYLSPGGSLMAVTTPRLTTLIALGLTAALTMPMLAQQGADADYEPVTSQRLRNPEPHNWLMYRRTYNGWGYSPARSDHRGQRGPPPTSLVILDWGARGARGAAHRQQWADVRHDAAESSPLARCRDR